MKSTNEKQERFAPFTNHTPEYNEENHRKLREQITEIRANPLPENPLKKINKQTKLVDSWVWNETVNNFIKGKIEGYSLNACAGKSELGDIKIDLDPQNRSVIKADMKKLPFDSETFDTVIQDPPWKIGYYDRWKPFFECVRVCKIGGKIIYNAYWVPDSRAVELKEVIIRQDSAFTNTSVISIFRKTTNEYDKSKTKGGD